MATYFNDVAASYVYGPIF